MFVGLNPRSAAVLSRRLTLTERVRAMYTPGRVGVMFDTQDLSTMYTTRAGSTPIGTPGNGTAQFVGRWEDKSLGRVLWPELVTNGDGSSAVGWTSNDAGVTISASAGKLAVSTGAIANRGAIQDLTVTAGKTYEVSARYSSLAGASVSVRVIENPGGAFACQTPDTTSAVEGPGSAWFLARSGYTYQVYCRVAIASATGYFDNISVRELSGHHALAPNDTTGRPQLSARVNLLLATATLSTQSVTTVATGYTLRFTGAGTITLSGTATGSFSAGSHAVTCTAGTLTLTVAGAVNDADLRPTNIHAAGSVPAYQRVTAAEDYDSVGFPFRFIPNGTGQAFQTSTITPGSDTVTVVAGVRKTSDAALQIVAEHTASLAANNGAWYLSAPNAASASIAFSSKGTAAAAAVTASLTAPLTRVLTGTGKIPTDTCALALNGAASSTDATDQGTGDYAAAVTNLFARGGASNWFGGQAFRYAEIYGTLTPAETATLEAWVNESTKAY